eukprot:gnl/TRDRNA2_/TRDRNA2_28470_c0_seq1.p1 gnl/TRDRNA2_/TRDRNA2_28470_c0~~gnl/TRDRNA2_/TRDRNA2_28470_c0_seq1.p1  ORF type:complete len:149 (+),score=49.54 gnl/TRDRNA2_/TRDRNA2_28470_c0_seq1:72-518(+)
MGGEHSKMDCCATNDRKAPQDACSLPLETIESLDTAMQRLQMAIEANEEEMLQEAIKQCEMSEVCLSASTQVAAEVAARKKKKAELKAKKEAQNEEGAGEDSADVADDEIPEIEETDMVKFQRALVIAKSKLSMKITSRLATESKQSK